MRRTKTEKNKLKRKFKALRYTIKALERMEEKGLKEYFMVVDDKVDFVNIEWFFSSLLEAEATDILNVEKSKWVVQAIEDYIGY